MKTTHRAALALGLSLGLGACSGNGSPERDDPIIMEVDCHSNPNVGIAHSYLIPGVPETIQAIEKSSDQRATINYSAGKFSVGQTVNQSYVAGEVITTLGQARVFAGALPENGVDFQDGNTSISLYCTNADSDKPVDTITVSSPSPR